MSSRSSSVSSSSLSTSASSSASSSVSGSSTSSSVSSSDTSSSSSTGSPSSSSGSDVSTTTTASGSVRSNSRSSNNKEEEKAPTGKTGPSAPLTIPHDDPPRASVKARRPPLATPSVSSLASHGSTRVETAAPGHVTSHTQPPPSHVVNTAPSFVSFNALPSQAAQDAFEAALAAVNLQRGRAPSGAAEKSNERKRQRRSRKKEKRKRERETRTRRGRRRRGRSASPSSAASSSASSVDSPDDKDNASIGSEARKGRKHKRTRRDIKAPPSLTPIRPPPPAMALSEARRIASALLTAAASQAAIPEEAAEAAFLQAREDDHVITIYVNKVETQVPRAEPFVNPALLFAPHVLLLDSTCVVRLQAQLPDILQRTSAAVFRAAAEVIRRERLRLRSDQGNRRVLLFRAITRAHQRRAAEPTPSPEAAPLPDASPLKEDDDSSINAFIGDSLKRRAQEAVAAGIFPQEQLDRLAEAIDERHVLLTELHAVVAAASMKQSMTPLYVLWDRYVRAQRTQTQPSTEPSSPPPRKTSGIRKLPEADAPSGPHSVLLLPSPTTGLVRVHEGHHYFTVKFVGEHLRLTGRLSQWLPPTLPSGAAAPPTQRSVSQSEGGADDGSTTSVRDTAAPWASAELRGLLKYLQRHPGESAEEYYRLTAEETAVHTVMED